MIKLTPPEQTNHERSLKNAKVHKSSELDLIDNLKVADELGYFRKLGFSSLYEYAHRGLELDEAASYKLMAIARKSRKVPELKMALESGSMTVSNAKVLVSVITPENKDHWIGLAQDLTKPKLEREVAKVSPKAAVQERASVLTEDLMKVVMALSSEAHEILKRALDLESQRMGKAASYDDAIKAMGEVYLKARDPVQKARRASTRAEERAKINCPSGTVEEQIDFLSIPPPKSQRIDVPYVRTPNPAAIQHQVTMRDQARCTHISNQGRRCESRRWLDVHHRIPISHGGTNDLKNLTTLCRAHHSMRHQ